MERVTIVVNDIAASPGGGLTVLKEFYEAVKRSRDDINWVFLLSQDYLEETSNIKVILLPQVKNHLNRLIFDFFAGWKIINQFNPSVVFSLQNTVVYHTKGKKITYVHQPLPFQSYKNFSFLKKEEFGLACIQHLLGGLIKKSIKTSDLTIVQTKWMKEAVENQCNIKTVEQIRPNLPNVYQKASYTATSSFFYPTGNVSYKNNELLIKAAKQLAKEKIESSILMTIEKGEKTGNITYLGRISIQEVYNHYKDSCLVFPSYIETFGYPLVEARSAGSLILASDCAFSHELLDGYENAYFFNPFSEEELFELMRKVAIGEIQRRDTYESIHSLDACNSWDQVVNTIMQLAIMD